MSWLRRPASGARHGRRGQAVTSRHKPRRPPRPAPCRALRCLPSSSCSTRNTMGIDFHLIANFGALALITLAGPAVIFILFYRRGAL